ncbi:MAG: LptF/LptG family permease [Bacteroidota bacterium]|nr:LptF/LptG family permease [Bacteroidota bacterium]
MKKLDLYIIKKFLGTFFFAIILIITIVIIFDISEKVDDFIQKQAPLKAIIFDYYLNFIPYFVNLFSPLFTFISVVFFTAKLASNTEIIAILASGISFRRLLRPYIYSSLILAVMSFYLSNFVIPPANRKRLEFENTYINSKARCTEKNIHKQIRPGTFIYLESFNSSSNTGYKFTIEKIKEGKLSYKLAADFINWDSIKCKWQINNYKIRRINGMIESMTSGNRLDTTINLTPYEFIRKKNNIETMNYAELNKFIAEERLKGSENIEFYLVEKHKRIAFPFATLVLTLIGVSLSSRKVRGGIGMHIGTGLTISFSFILFMQVSTTFATNGNLSPFISVWIPNLIFGALGIYLLRTAPK